MEAERNTPLCSRSASPPRTSVLPQVRHPLLCVLHTLAPPRCLGPAGSSRHRAAAPCPCGHSAPAGTGRGARKALLTLSLASTRRRRWEAAAILGKEQTPELADVPHVKGTRVGVTPLRSAAAARATGARGTRRAEQFPAPLPAAHGAGRSSQAGRRRCQACRDANFNSSEKQATPVIEPPSFWRL